MGIEKEKTHSQMMFTEKNGKTDLHVIDYHIPKGFRFSKKQRIQQKQLKSCIVGYLKYHNCTFKSCSEGGIKIKPESQSRIGETWVEGETRTGTLTEEGILNTTFQYVNREEYEKREKERNRKTQ